jgi:hypothetical protein
MVVLGSLPDELMLRQFGCAILVSYTLDGQPATYEEHAVDIVDITILPSAKVEGVLGDRDLRSVKHGWLLHQLWTRLKSRGGSPRSCRSRCTGWMRIPALVSGKQARFGPDVPSIRPS